jgi:hypothetical protein
MTAKKENIFGVRLRLIFDSISPLPTGSAAAMVSVLLLGAMAMYVVGYGAIFSSFSRYDDEGANLIQLKSFISNGSLYNSVYGQYGPFFYQALGALFSLMRVPITHDAGRFVTLSFWIASSMMIGISAYKLTRNIAIALAVQLVVFGSLSALVDDPMWPGGLIATLLSGAALVATTIRQSAPIAISLLGVIIACLILTKINVGILALAAFLLTAAQLYRVFVERKWLKVSIEIGFVLTPLLLMLPNIQEIWVQRYAIHVCAAAAALVWVMRSHRVLVYRSNRELVLFGGALCSTMAFICLYAMSTGTSWNALFNAIIVNPLLVSSVFITPIQIPVSLLALDAIALLAAYVHVRNIDNKQNLSRASVLLAIGFASVFATLSSGSILPRVNVYELITLSFCWMALIHEDSTNQVSVFVRRLVPAFALIQALHAYPVAGSQRALSCFLLVIVGAILISDAIIDLRCAHGNGGVVPCGTTSAVMGLMVLLAIGSLSIEYRFARRSFDLHIPLGLIGSNRIRLAPEQAMLYRKISEAINESCKSFITLPGLNSFYLWTGQDPPSHFNVGFWTALFDDRLQEQLVRNFENIDRLCLLKNNALENFWAKGKVPKDGPLVAFSENAFQPIAVFGDYELSRRAQSSAPHQTMEGGRNNR